METRDKSERLVEMSDMNIGIVGQGYVGTAVRVVIEQHFHVETFDIAQECTCTSLSDLVKKVQIIFICLPTPMRKDGSCDTGLVLGCCGEINAIAQKESLPDVIVALKSTVPPGTTDNLDRDCPHIQVIFNPEFLTERNFIEDFKNQNRVIIGGPKLAIEALGKIYTQVLPKAEVLLTGAKEAEMIKYLTNTFLATKVSFANEMKLLCDALGIKYDDIVKYATFDGRLGKSHWAVPGPDGKVGFGGSCLPKDLNALLAISKELGVSVPTLHGVWKTNVQVRKQRDWEALKGRAVVDDDQE